MEDPTVYNSEKVAHRVAYRLNALLLRVGRLFELFKPVNDLIEDFAPMNPKETADLTFKHRHRHARKLVERRETSEWVRIRPEWICPLRAKQFEPCHHRYCSRVRSDRSLSGDNLHSSGVGQAEGKTTEGGHRDETEADRKWS
jgi:hypothetical protein